MLIAAEGGGIRAAYWTTAILDQLVSTARETRGGRVCAQAMVSSGASGGSVGLSIASVSSPGAASIQTEKIAQPRALAAASDGLVLRDTIYAATGVPVPSLSDGTSEHDTPWLDRASLIEQAWENDESGIAELDEPFLDAPLAWAEWGPPGAMVLNSTSSTTACRTLVSQVELPLSSDPGSADRTAGVCSPSGGVAGSTDLIDCTGPLRTTTAALLTARFPYVTPSGVVSCDDGDPDTDDEQQIVDGGYAENSGIGTLVDVMPSIMRLVRAHNSCVISRLDAAPAVETEGDCDAAPTTVVVPLLLYLDNGTGSDLVERPGGLSPEIVVPPATLLSSMASLVSARSQLQRAQALLATDQLWGEDLAETHEVVAAVEAMRPKGAAYVAYQATTPSIGAPLGWVLSDTSICTIERSLASGAQDQGFGFGTLSAFTKASLGVTYAGSDDSHC